MRGAVRRGREGGFIVYVIVVFVVVGAALGLATRGAFDALVRDRPRERASVAATWAAAGGIEAARAALSRDPGYAGGTLAVGRGSAAVTVTAVPGEPGLRILVSLGEAPGPAAARRRIEARVRLGEGLPRILAWRED